MVKNVVSRYINNRSCVLGCFLDASKAFDLVNHDILFHKLSVRGLPLPVIRFLSLWYCSQQMKVRWDHSLSESFHVSNGVRQGGVLSPVLFAVYLDGLLEELDSRKLFVQEWNVKPHRGRQRKYWCKVVDHLFSSLGLDKAEWLEDIREGSCSLKSFLGVAGEGIDERESGKFEEGLNSKVKLSLYRTFGKIVEFKKYLRGVGDAGTRLLFKFRSGTHGLNEELGRHRGREGRKECLLCDAECESVSHVLWDCPAYVSIRSAFMLELRRELGDRFEHFQSLDSFEKSSYVLGSEAWEEYSSGLLGLIKDFVLSVWEERKVRLYGEHANVHQSHSQNDSGDLRGVAGGNGELGCLCGKAGTSHLCDGSAHSSGCVVNGSNAMAAV